MESPKPETKKEQYGCSALIIRLVFCIGVIVLFDYASEYIFRAVVPYSNTTTALIPFQNHYLATTDAFITSEGSTSEFTNDPGVTTRFINLGIFVFILSIILAVVLYAIPPTRKLLDYFWYILLFFFVLTLAYAMFYPPVMTIFDRDNKVMIVNRPNWMFFGTREEIPFDDLSGFTYEIERVDGNDHVEDVEYIDLFAITVKGDRIFVGENQVGSHASSVDTPIPQERITESENVVKALNTLIGK